MKCNMQKTRIFFFHLILVVNVVSTLEYSCIVTDFCVHYVLVP